MALASDLTLVGFDTRDADFLGDTVADNITALGVTQGTAYPLMDSINRVTVSTAPNNGVVLPNIIGSKYSRIMVRNDEPINALAIYPGGGNYINGNAIDIPVVIGANTSLIFFKISTVRWITR